MILTTYFADFLKRIRLPKPQVDALIEAHTTLRERLGNDEVFHQAIFGGDLLRVKSGCSMARTPVSANLESAIMKKSARRILMTMVLGLTLPLAEAAGGGAAPAPPSPAPSAAPEPQDAIGAATALYNDGVKKVEQADKAGAEPDKARKAYAAALKKFEAAVDRNPNLHQAWNYVGYCRRQLGDHGGALGAYDEALRLSPGYAEALEYRGHAFLGLDRIDDAKQAYLDVFARNRALSAKLLGSIRSWSVSKRQSADADAKALDGIDAWVVERDKLATQTAALSRAGSAAAWN